MNYKCVCIISFIFFKFRSTVQNHSFNWRGDFYALDEYLMNIFSVLPHSRRLKSDTPDLLLWHFEPKLFDWEGKYISQRYLEVATRSSYMYNMWERIDVRTLRAYVYNKGHQKSRETTHEIWRSEREFMRRPGLDRSVFDFFIQYLKVKAIKLTYLPMQRSIWLVTQSSPPS